MKTRAFLIVFSFILLAACREADPVLPAQPTQPNQPVGELPVTAAVAGFQGASSLVRESDVNASIVTLQLSKAAPADGTLVVKWTSPNGIAYGVDFVTVPQPVNGEIVLAVGQGETSVNFSVAPVQNDLFIDHRVVQFVLDRSNGGVAVAANASYKLVIEDDELRGRLRKYESVAGSWRASREYIYAEEGSLKEINWSSFTPSQLSGSYQYHREGGKVVRMTDEVGAVTLYQWQGDRVVQSEKYRNEQLKQRVEFGYDDAGNVGEMVYYDRQPDGTLQRSILIVFLYYQDGNIYKKLVYACPPDEEPVLASTHTFENYLNRPNPVPMVETLPHLNPQPSLPRTYRVEAGDKVINYHIDYLFRNDGLLQHRIVSDGKTSESTYYTYY